MADKNKQSITALLKKGEIVQANLKPDEKNCFHPIIFLEKIDDLQFIGCIISHDPNKGNIKMSINHFQNKDENGKPYEIQYDDTYLVYKRYIKLAEWINKSIVAGKLTDEGILFVENQTPKNIDYHPFPVWVK